MNRAIIERYAEGAREPARAIAGLSREDLVARPVAGRWSTQEVILHLMDSDLVGSDRMKRVIAEDRPLLLAYDESRWVRGLGYERADITLACEVFEKNRLMTAAMLRRLPDEAFARAGVHTERGLETLEELVHDYVRHLEHHLKFIAEKRRALGR